MVEDDWGSVPLAWGSEDEVGGGMPEVGQARVAGHGGCGEEVGGAGVGT